MQEIKRQDDRPLTDEEAAVIDNLYRQYSGMMLAVARRMLHSTSDAEDVVHQLFCRLPRLLVQFNGHSMGGWLKRATVTESLMHLRRGRGRRECDLEVPGIETAMQTCAPHDSEIHWALRRLSPSLREVIVLRYFMSYSHRYIAVMLGISEAASEIRACRGVKQLRLILHPAQLHEHSVGSKRKFVERISELRAS